jgi:hypothetical protein
MGQLRDRMEADLTLGGCSPATQKIYVMYARQYAKYFMRSPAEMERRRSGSSCCTCSRRSSARTRPIGRRVRR